MAQSVERGTRKVELKVSLRFFLSLSSWRSDWWWHILLNGRRHDSCTQKTSFAVADVECVEILKLIVGIHIWHTQIVECP